MVRCRGRGDAPAMWREFQHDRDQRLLRLTSPTLKAPADRAQGWRGWRGVLAVAALVGALVAGGQANYGLEDSWSIGKTTVDYTLNGPGWTTPMLWIAATALVVAAGLVWLARRPVALIAGLVLLGLAAAGAALAIYERKHPGRDMVKADVYAVPLGSSRDEVTAALGGSAGHGVVRHPGVRLDCLVYQGRRIWVHGKLPLYALCFHEDRLVERAQL